MSADTQDYAAFRSSLGLPPPADGEGPGVLPLPLPTHAPPVADADDLEPELEDMTLEPGASNALTRSPKHVNLQMDNWADAEESDDEAAPAAADVPNAAAAPAPAAEAVPNAAPPAPAPATRFDADDLLATCLAFDDADDAAPASAPPNAVEPYVHDHSFDYEAAERLPPKPKFSVETARAAGEYYDRR